ncbi:MAG: 4Fe-4S binding protein [Clostridia bacterium]|nr:4Fe-4S binding protein [Clostridia bacterium]
MFRITDECIACGICADECPSGSISEGDDIFVIDQDTCTECGSCQDACPNDAIVEE